MSQIRLNYLTLISMERDIIRELKIDDIIKRFAKKKRENISFNSIYVYVR